MLRKYVPLKDHGLHGFTKRAARTGPNRSVTMRNINSLIIIVFIIVLLGGPGCLTANAADAGTRNIEVPLTDPGKPAELKMSAFQDSIAITGYNGKNVLVEITEKEKKKTGHKHEHEADHKDGKNEKTASKNKGMYKVAGTSNNFIITEENNKILIKSKNMSGSNYLHFSIKVPFSTSLNLKTHDNGDVKINRIDGDIVVKHYNGNILLTDIGGTVVANAMNGDVKATFKKVALNAPMSFSTFSGDLDITFPANAKFNLKMNVEKGEIFSDFKLKTIEKPNTSSKKRQKNGKFVVKVEKTIYAELNGGGEEVFFKTYSGNIYIRKK